MLINEIFNTKVKVDWVHNSSGYEGSFILDNTEFKIQLDEYTVKLSNDYSVIDFGFTREGSWDLTHDNSTSSAKIFGAIFNAFVEKINILKPDIILFGVNNKNGSIQERKSLYMKLANWWIRGTTFKIIFNWLKTSNGEYTILSKISLSDIDKENIQKFIKTIPLKEE